jgi:hypothetical protein
VWAAAGCVEETMDFLVELVFGEVLPKIFDLSVEDRGDCRFGTSASVASVSKCWTCLLFHSSHGTLVRSTQNFRC